jgi:hypothetical protein
MRRVSVLVIVALAAFASWASAAPSERDQRLLTLGSSLGPERLEILTWPEGGEVSRLRPQPADPSDRDRTVIGKFREHEVLEGRRLTDVQVKLLANALLDTEVFEGLGIRRPVRPGRFRTGAGKMCGGFRPIIGLRFKDAEDRALEVLLCFSCSEMAFGSVGAKSGTPSDRLSHFGISPRGSARLLRYLSEIFPDDKVIGWLRNDREKSAGPER